MRIRVLSPVLALAVALVIAASEASLRAQDPARGAIEAGNRKFMAAFNKQDAAGIAATYSPDASAFPPNASIIKGRAGIQKMWQDVLNSGIASASLVTTEVESSGNLAYESGTYEMKLKDGKVADKGKYCVVWKRINGQWMLHRDIWNTDMPTPKQP